MGISELGIMIVGQSFEGFAQNSWPLMIVAAVLVILGIGLLAWSRRARPSHFEDVVESHSVHNTDHDPLPGRLPKRRPMRSTGMSATFIDLTPRRLSPVPDSIADEPRAKDPLRPTFIDLTDEQHPVLDIAEPSDETEGVR